MILAGHGWHLTGTAVFADAGRPCRLDYLVVCSAENQRAVGFFTALGFEPHGAPTPIPGMRGRGGERSHQQMMVRAVT